MNESWQNKIITMKYWVKKKKNIYNKITAQTFHLYFIFMCFNNILEKSTNMFKTAKYSIWVSCLIIICHTNNNQKLGYDRVVLRVLWLWLRWRDFWQIHTKWHQNVLDWVLGVLYHFYAILIHLRSHI